MYKIYNTETGSVIIVETNNSISSIPFNEELPEYQAYLAWVAEGNVAEEWNPNGN
jgi:hypothetical protein